MEDLVYVKKHGRAASYTFLVDSSKRDASSYPSPSEYVIEFNAPFRKVVGIELLDAHVPRTENAITSTTNTLVYKVGTHSKTVATLPIAQYATVSSCVEALNGVLTNGLSVSEAHGRAVFAAASDFTIYLSESTLARVLGFPSRSVQSVTSKDNSLTSPGLINLAGPPYVVVRCPELETLVQHDRHFEKWNPGIGMVKFVCYGLTCEPNFTPYPLDLGRVPLARLGSLTIRLEKPDGSLYDTGGLDHALLVRLHWIDAPLVTTSMPPQLNPDYSPDPLSATTYEGSQQPRRDDSNSQSHGYYPNFDWRHPFGR